MTTGFIVFLIFAFLMHTLAGGEWGATFAWLKGERVGDDRPDFRERVEAGSKMTCLVYLAIVGLMFAVSLVWALLIMYAGVEGP